MNFSGFRRITIYPPDLLSLELLRIFFDRFSAIITVANGGNPTGSSLNMKRREKMLELADEHDLLIIEDDPYYFLQFEELKILPSLFELDWCSENPKKRVIRSDSFSKVLSAGIRIGWITGPKDVIQKVELAAQSSCLHTPSLIQVLCSELLQEWGVDGFEGKDFTKKNENVRYLQNKFQISTG